MVKRGWGESEWTSEEIWGREMQTTSRQQDDDVVFVLADTVVSIRYEDIPEDVVENTKNSILDTVGNILAGSTFSTASEKIVALVKEAAGFEESTILVFGGKVPCWMAAFANGSMGHVLDYDDMHYEAAVHPTMSTFPAALATAERVHRLSGKEFITAIAVANDIICRMALAVTRGSKELVSGWNFRQVLGYFSAAAASGKMLNLDREQMVSSFGIASQLAAGTSQVAVGIGSTFRGIYPAPAGLGGVLSAIMAQKGITGPMSSLEGKAGLYRVYFDDLYDRDSITSGLGKNFESGNVGFKPWPCCGFAQTYVEATLRLIKEFDIRPDDITEITVVVGNAAQRLCEPLEMRQRPPTSEDARWSIPWVVACAAARKKVIISDFTPEGIKSPEVLNLAQKVTPRFDPTLNVSGRMPPGKIEIKARNEVFSKQVDYPYGHPQNPITRDDLISKFMDCASHSAKPLSKSNREALVKTISELEKIDDIRPMIELAS